MWCEFFLIFWNIFKLLNQLLYIIFCSTSQVFPKDSPLAIDISKAILEVTQSGELQQLENNLLSSDNCSSLIDLNNNPELGPEPFYGLFFVSGSISVFAFLIITVRLVRNRQLNLHLTSTTFIGSRIWIWAIMFLIRTHLKFQFTNRRRSSIIPDPVEELNEIKPTCVVVAVR